MGQPKKVNYNQRKELAEYGITDTRDWRFVGTYVTDLNGATSAGKNRPHIVQDEFLNIVTHEKIIVKKED